MSLNIASEENDQGYRPKTSVKGAVVASFLLNLTITTKTLRSNVLSQCDNNEVKIRNIPLLREKYLGLIAGLTFGSLETECCPPISEHSGTVE